jgi:hypothetical protein
MPWEWRLGMYEIRLRIPGYLIFCCAHSDWGVASYTPRISRYEAEVRSNTPIPPCLRVEKGSEDSRRSRRGMAALRQTVPATKGAYSHVGFASHARSGSNSGSLTLSELISAPVDDDWGAAYTAS